MSLNIKNEDVTKAAARLAALLGTSKTQAILQALQEKLERETRAKHPPRSGMAERLDAIAKKSAALPVLDTRSLEEILGYNEDGLPQ